MFSGNYYEQNRQKLLAELGEDPLVIIAGHAEMQQAGDMLYPFRQDSNTTYLCGVSEPNAVLVFSAEHSFLVMQARSEFTALWDGQSTYEQLKNDSGVDLVLNTKLGWQRIGQVLAKHANVVICEPGSKTAWSGTLNPGRSIVKTRIKRRISPKQTLSDARPALATLRTVKQPEELAALQKASDITAQGYKDVSASISTSHFEYELMATFTSAFQRQGSDHAYTPIVASGARSCVLHYTDNNQPISDNLVLFDVAASWQGYHSDVSRTLPHTEPFNPRQQAVYDAVLRVQKATIDHVRTGMTFIELDTYMREQTADELVELGLSKTPSIDDTKKYLPHSSHFIGLDVHDVGDYRAPLLEDTVFTLEPGIYIPQEGIGVRIEDVIHLTATGAHVLTKSIPK